MRSETMADKKVSANMITALKSAEETLAAEEKQERVRNLGDLADLPPGHPLLIQMEQAKARHEQKVALQEQIQIDTTGRTIRKAKRLGEINDHKRKQAEEQKQDGFKRMASTAQEINVRIAQYAKETDEFVGFVHGTEEQFKSQPYLKSKLQKLLRMSYAIRRGLDESVIKPHHIRIQD